jgi:hypothetical protein
MAMVDLTKTDRQILTDKELAPCLGFSRRKLRAIARNGGFDFKEVDGVYFFEVEAIRRKLGIKKTLPLREIHLN